MACASLGASILWFHISLVLFALIFSQAASGESVMLTSPSMSPALRVGDVLVTETPTEENLRPGRVVVYRQDNHLVTHRLVTKRTDSTPPASVLTPHHLAFAESSNTSWTTKGDANLKPDSAHVPIPAIKGVGRLVIPMVGLPRIWIDTAQWPRLLAWATMLAISTSVVVAFTQHPADPQLSDDSDLSTEQQRPEH